MSIETEAKRDQQVIDQIANILAEPEWDVEYLEYVADLIGSVRPHPGGYETRNEYATDFLAATGRDVIDGDEEE